MFKEISKLFSKSCFCSKAHLKKDLNNIRATFVDIRGFADPLEIHWRSHPPASTRPSVGHGLGPGGPRLSSLRRWPAVNQAADRKQKDLNLKRGT